MKPTLSSTRAHLSPFISVIVPVFNDQHRVRQCLSALEAQSYPSSRYEVIVVDNGSSPPLDLGQSFPHSRLVREARAGSYVARNAGVAIATGDVFAFTDSDCVPGPQWLDESVRALGQLGGEGIVVGCVEQVPLCSGRLSLWELYGRIFWLRQKYYAEEVGFGATANLVTHRNVMARVGPFDAVLSGGDEEWCLRAKSLGIAIAYAPEATVSHPTMRTLAELVAKSRRVVGGQMLRKFRQRCYSTRDLFQDLGNDVNRDVRRRFRYLRDTQPGLGRGRRRAMYALVQFLQVVRAFERVRLFCGGMPRRR